MTDSPYWNPRHETMPREQIEALQLRKLRNLLEWADGNVPWQAKRLRDAGVTSDQIASLEDLRRIPLFTRDDWMQALLIMEQRKITSLVVAGGDLKVEGVLHLHDLWRTELF